MRVELGAPVILAPPSPALWHLPELLEEIAGRRARGNANRRALCGLVGDRYVYAGAVRARRLCPVCRARSPARDHWRPELGPLPARRRPDGRRPRFTRVQLEELAAVHARGMSLRAIARRLYAELGYSSADSMTTVLARSLRREGFPVRPRDESNAIAQRRRRDERLARDGAGALRGEDL